MVLHSELTVKFFTIYEQWTIWVISSVFMSKMAIFRTEKKSDSNKSPLVMVLDDQ